ncbi:MAG: HTTM domain-containing protein [Pirellulales bacterium]
MTLIGDYFRELSRSAVTGWNRFWFTPQDPATLGLIRILAGAMLFYTHLVWSLDLAGFFGSSGWLAPEALTTAYGDARALFWSHWHWIDSPVAMWVAHLAALVIFALFTVGLFTRVVSILAWLLTVSYAHRVMPAALFGLDDINVMLAMYLMIGPSGAAYSLDGWLAQRKGRAGQGGTASSVSVKVAIRLMQIHLCIIYLFSGLGKAMGETWWDGSAMWLAVANYEYQSIDLTWLADWPAILSLFAHVTVAWELSYPALVWPRLTRPLVVAMSVPIHLGIALFLGMMTFGLVMIIANLAFVSPGVVRTVLDRTTTGQGRGDASAK